MLFTVGVETPKAENEAFGLVVPALFNEEYSCFSAADTTEEIVPMVTEAIHLMLEGMAEDGFDISQIKDQGFTYYKQQEDFAHCDSWLLIDVDITAYFGKRQRVNVVLPQYLIDRIDNRVAHSHFYRDRSHFLAVASQNELQTTHQ
ncbi:type II toxin-antitoxin system HicB family antitoxin [Rodentibacter caecimuris]|uniref:type II toxin-antitoxin system HicB family antitoxin n=1 Tax=Rodentibacter caecimuris TaxID=1796644 RepID=UPI002249481F|nr:type II toxin-antitoxin system HicB family antitoxin [Rodentibacter heylii]MCX2960317.1 type II toxin-antitoxin system HicB family antitoxin [Rodentibacter heylii]